MKRLARMLLHRRVDPELQSRERQHPAPGHILIDQYGRIQWRGTGGGPDVLARLERAVTTAVHRSTLPAEANTPMARQEGTEADTPATRVR